MADVVGTSGDDILDRRLNGTSSDDNLYGYTGLNWFQSSLGSDSFFGGPGTDLIFYSNQSGPISLNNTSTEQDGLAAYNVLKTGGGIDTLNSIENFHATAYDDTIFLDTQTNGYIFLEGGSDTLVVTGSEWLTVLQESGGSSNVVVEGGMNFFPVSNNFEIDNLSSLAFQDGATFFEPFAIYEGDTLLSKAWLLPDNKVRIEKYYDGSTQVDIIESTNAGSLLLTHRFEGSTNAGWQKNISTSVDFDAQTLTSTLENLLAIEVDSATFDLETYIDQYGVVLGEFDRIVIGTWQSAQVDNIIAATISSDVVHISGGNGNDILTGGQADDNLRGEADNDTLYGLAGNDRLRGGSGDDLMFGGVGDDTYVYNYLGSDEITEDSNSGYDIIRIENEGNGFGDIYYANGAIFVASMTNPDLNTLKINGFANFEELVWKWGGGEYSLKGIVTSQSIPDGEEQLYAGTKGADYIQTYDTPIYVEVYASDGDDEVRLSEQNTGSWVSGGAGADLLYGSGGNDTIHGDYRRGYEGDTSDWNDVIYGLGGNDNLIGNQGIDKLYGGDGSDYLNGGSGQGYDELYGGAGVDRLAVNHGVDLMWGGDDDDLFVVQRFSEEAFASIKDHSDGEKIILLVDADNPDAFSFEGNVMDSIRVTHNEFNINETTLYVTQNGVERSVANLNGIKNVSEVSLNDEGYNLTFTTGATDPPEPGLFTLTGNTANGISTINLSLNVEAEPNLTSLQSLDLKLDFDETNFNFISANFEAGLIGSVNDQDGILNLAAISLNSITDFTNVLVELDFSNLGNLSTTNAVISDVLINETSYSGGSVLIDLTSDTYLGSVVTRDGSAMLDVLIESTSGNSTNSGLDGSFSIETSGGGDLINGSFNIDPSLNLFSSADALDALRLAVGMNTQKGTKSATDYIAADFNQDGKVTSADALAILKHAVGLSAGAEPEWVFIDSDGDYSGINQSSVVYQDGVTVPLSSGSTAISLTGILIGDVNDSYSGLIA